MSQRNLHALEIFQGKDGQWFVNLLYPNGNTIMTTESYTRHWSARRSAKRLAKAFGLNDIRERLL